MSASAVVDGPLELDAGDLLSAVGTVLPASRWLPVDQPRIDLFADATDDHQWIHVDADRASSGPYGGTIAHGFLTLSLVAPLLKNMLTVRGASGALNYGLERVRFPSAVRSGQAIRATGSVSAADETPHGVRVRLALVIEVQGQVKPACAFDLIILYAVASS